MLVNLKVRNFAIIDELELDFPAGLNVLTGETGAGKSIIIGAMGLVLGERGYTEMIKTGQDTATVDATFHLPGHPALQRYDGQNQEIHITRVVSRGGRGKAYINGKTVSIQALAELGNSLVDVHGQHEHQSLLSADNQMALLDRYGELSPDRERVGGLYEETATTARKLDALRRNAREREQQVDMLGFQISEIDGATLNDGEDETLNTEFKLLSNLGRLKELVEGAYTMLYSDEGAAMERTSSALSSISEVVTLDDEAEDALTSLEQAVALLEDAAITVRGMRDKYDMDPARLDFIQDRIEVINRLKKKYGETIADILKFRDDAADKLDTLQSAGESAGELERILEEKTIALESAARELSDKRKNAALKLETSVMVELRSLALENAAFKISIDDAPVTATGMDAVEFMFSANVGEMVKPLNKVASGGELSRIMLAMKTVLREVDNIPVLVFDEVDAGIGGKTANNVGARLAQAAQGRQVLCITHLPQIAAAGDTQFLIKKSTRDNDTSVQVLRISGTERDEEIARMLSGSVTSTSLKHARELLRGDTGETQ